MKQTEMKTEQEEVKHTLPEKIGAVNYAGFFDFSENGMYDASVINAMDYPNAEQIADEIARRYNEFPSLKSQLQQLQEEKSKSDSEVKTLREALIKCLCIFQRLADEGKYPDFMLQANGGEGFLFITSALQSKGESGLDTKE